ncbi:MAG: 2-oxo acid dehydrogenase subunit E2 [Alphaproteobacteria bacterium]|nr:2-oxo acid dehydrogenase subunit E2 [Alphaproteobacteria bacterium]MDE2163426.1 2-oxo acid dehydrogenase subunit E2 [Alphaproteobacteria bacterium]
MARYVFKLPDVGEGMAEAEIVAWHVAVGDKIQEDQNLVDVMTDKATVEITSPVTGIVVSLGHQPGEMAAIGAPLVEFELDGAAQIAITSQKSEPAPSEAIAVPADKNPIVAGAKTLASPAVRKRAQDMGVDLRSVTGTSPDGRISHADLDKHLASSGGRTSARAQQVPRNDVEEVKLIGLRRRIADKMQESKRRIPHFAYVEEIDMTELEKLRAKLNASKRPEQPKLNVLPFLMRVLVHVLPEYPQINAQFDDEAGIIHRFLAVHIGIATQTANGLLVPVVKHAERRNLWEAAAEVARVAALARENKASKDDLTGSTITITSLGAMGGVVTTPIINHPEVAIIGPNAIMERPVVRDGEIVVRKMMNLSSCFDHRVVDGADAAAFVQRLKGLLEHPDTLL